MKHIYLFLSALILCLSTQVVQAGNPDRQGEAGAYELLMNPWARSAGLHGLIAAHGQGIESMRFNVAGLAGIEKTQFIASHALYIGDVSMSAAGFGQRIGKSSVIGVSFMSVNFGDIPVTTTEQPDGTGATFSPSFFNIGVSYSYVFANNISIGATVRMVSESVSNVTATGVALDAGIQYVTGPKDNIRLGIALRNVGTPVKYSGEGLAFQFSQTNSNGADPFTTTGSARASQFELPTVLHIGGAYDIHVDDKNMVTLLAQFNANTFSRDQFGLGVEYGFRKMFMVRAAYRYEVAMYEGNEPESAYTGLSAGASVEVPVKKGSNTKLGIDYAYRTTHTWSGVHNIGIRFTL